MVTLSVVSISSAEFKIEDNLKRRLSKINLRVISPQDGGGRQLAMLQKDGRTSSNTEIISKFNRLFFIQ